MKFRFFDFEVLPNWWCCVFGDLPEDWKQTGITRDIKETFVTIDSDMLGARDKLMTLLYEKDIVKSGYNIKGYDLIIANAIYQGLTPREVKIISDMIINPSLAYKSRENYLLSSFTKRKLSNILFADLMDDANGSLKEKEAILGLNILESDVSFDKQNLTSQDKDSIIYYCKQDVYAAMQFYMQVAEPYITTKLAVAEHFNIPTDTAYKSTNARMVALALKAKRKSFEDAEKIEIELPNKIRQYCYENVPSKILERLMTSTEGFTVKLFNNDVSYGNGGIHSVYCKELYVESDDEWTLTNIDAESYYPSMLIQFDTLSRAVQDRGSLKYIFDERMKIKHKENKTEYDNFIQLADKLILNTTFGASGNKWLDLYDPHNCTKTCRLGQIFLTALAMKLTKTVPSLKIIQTNTDGILSYFRRKDIGLVRKCMKEWTEISGINMEEDEIQKIWQRDVNNYLLVKKDGKIKRKGGWLNDTIYRIGSVMLSPPAALVCNKAVIKYLIEGKDIIKSIVSCKDLGDFIMICTKGPTYRGTFQLMSDGTEIPLFKCNRVIATKDSSYGKIYKYKVYKGERRIAQMPNIPGKCLPVNEDLEDYNFNTISKTIDYSYYILRAMDLVNLDWQQLKGNELFKTDKFNYKFD